MAVKRVSPDEALALMRDQGYAYLDVRSVPEFEQGHPAGAWNVPLLHAGPTGSRPNPGFLDAVARAFPRDARIVVGCRTSSRSEHAAALLEGAGYTHVAIQGAGFVGHGHREPGWGPRGLPTSRSAEPGRSWDDLKEAR